MKTMLKLAAVCLAGLAGGLRARAAQGPETADSIMARVAANQDAAEAERAHYVYVQHTRMASRKGKTVQCEELTDYRITPTGDGSHDELLKLDGRLRVNGKYVSYNALEPDSEDGRGGKGQESKSKDSKESSKKESSENESSKKSSSEKESSKGTDRIDGSAASGNAKDSKDAGKSSKAKGDDDAVSVSIGEDGLDRDLVENMRKNLMHDKSKDGINARLFPLTSKQREQYTYTLAGRERLNGRDVFHITFRPKDKNDFGWKGEAYIDTAAYQPVLVTTEMARKIPFAVRTLLGTNVPGLGFTVVYAPQPDGVWFPVSFSSEFKIHVLYFFHRDIVLDAQNREFEKTHVTTRMLEGAAEVPASPQ